MKSWWNQVWAEQGRPYFTCDKDTGEVTKCYDLTPKQFWVMVSMLFGILFVTMALMVPIASYWIIPFLKGITNT